VVGAGHPVGGGRSLVEDPGGPARGLLQRPLEDPGVLPAGEYLVLKRGQVDLRGERLESLHRPSVAEARIGFSHDLQAAYVRSSAA